jgi:myo-inositol 2-dehydrogenase/D-chiro-inositol 1-dehydrogenase/scyllo-inositol 2-dehydrogenase (NAD+)
MHARNFRWRVPHAELAAVVDAEAERAQGAAEELGLGDAHYSSLEEAVASMRFDAIVITSPTFTHAALAAQAAHAGLHMLCEKPMALNLAECDRIIEAARQAGVILQMAFMRHFDPAFVAAKQQIDDGLIGQPLIVRSLTRGPGLPPPWARDIRNSNGMLAEVNSHDFDTIRWLAGGDFTSVFAQAAALKVPDLKEEYPDFYDTAVVTLQLDNGAFGMVDGVCPAEYGYDARAEVVGSQGVLFIGELREAGLTRVTRQGGAVERHFLTWPARFEQAYVNEARHFVDCVRAGEQPSVGGLDGRHALEAVLAANRSIQWGRPVRLPLGPEVAEGEEGRMRERQGTGSVHTRGTDGHGEPG